MVGSALSTLGLVAVAFALSLYERLGLEREIGVAVVRSFLQLAAIGYVINYIFGLKSIGGVALLLAGMILFAAWTSARRAGDVPRAFGGLRSPWGWRRWRRSVCCSRLG
jgi:putative ABC transport system permease protein